MPKKSRRANRQTKTIKVTVNGRTIKVVPQYADDFEYYTLKYKKIDEVVESYKEVGSAGIQPITPQNDYDYNIYIKQTAIVCAYEKYLECLRATKGLLKSYLNNESHSIDFYKIRIKECQALGDLFIYIHNKNYEKSLEYYKKTQELMSESLDSLMFEDLSKSTITTRAENNKSISIDCDESVRLFAKQLQAINFNIVALWKWRFKEDIDAVAKSMTSEDPTTISN